MLPLHFVLAFWETHQDHSQLPGWGRIGWHDAIRKGEWQYFYALPSSFGLQFDQVKRRLVDEWTIVFGRRGLRLSGLRLSGLRNAQQQ
ncbi:MAG: hypothetical protein R3C56_31715 [Pirellulaceae bacterium]